MSCASSLPVAPFVGFSLSLSLDDVTLVLAVDWPRVDTVLLVTASYTHTHAHTDTHTHTHTQTHTHTHTAYRDHNVIPPHTE